MRPAIDPAVEDILRAAVTHGLDGGRSWPTAPITIQDLIRVVDVAVDERLLGALAEAAVDGALSLTPEQFDHLAARHTGSQVHMLDLEHLLVATARLFDERGINFRVLKGFALAHTVYADPSWRTAADVDLLIPSDQFDEAVSLALDEFDGAQLGPELRPGFDREFGKESMIRVGRLELDLHRTFVTGPCGLTIELDALFREGTGLTIGDRTMFGLSPKHQFLHACYNAALGDYPARWCSVRDLLLFRQHLDVDLDDVVATASRWHGTAVVQRAGQLIEDIAGPDIEGGFDKLARLEVPRRDAWLLRSYLTSARSYSRPLASLAVIRGVRPRLRYAQALVSPSSDYLRSRGWTERSHIKRALRKLRSHD